MKGLERIELNESDLRVRSTSISEVSYDEVILEDRKFFRCLTPNCGKTFKFKFEINRHLRIHSDLRPYKCDFPNCNKTFKRNDALTHHKKTHFTKGSINCPISGCFSQFSSKSSLNIHIKKHHHNQQQVAKNEYSPSYEEEEPFKVFKSSQYRNRSRSDSNNIGSVQRPYEDLNSAEHDDFYDENDAILNNKIQFNQIDQISYKTKDDFKDEINHSDPLSSLKSMLSGDQSPRPQEARKLFSMPEIHRLAETESFRKISNNDLQDILSRLTRENNKLKEKLKITDPSFSEGSPVSGEVRDKSTFDHLIKLPLNFEALEDELNYDFFPLKLEDSKRNSFIYETR